jgi:thymidylate kinase
VGGVLVVAGPDGAGKTTLCDALVQVTLAGQPVLRMHHRPGLLPVRTLDQGPVTEPHASAPYSAALSLAKTCYLFVDFHLGWAVRIRPWVRRGGWVLLERGWWDIAVDPLRYRLRPPAKLARLLGRLLPRTDLTLILEAPEGVLLDRKRELPSEELSRQARAWRQLPPRAVRRVYLDASLPAEEVVRQAGSAMAAGSKGRLPAAGWTSLPRRTDGRWVLPRAPRAAAASGLFVYYPVTLKGVAGWNVARFAASIGAFRLLPRGAPPPQEVMAILEPHLPPRGTIALARANHPGRYVALLIDRHGHREGAAKIATDEGGREALERERMALEHYGHLLSPPLSPPRILTHQEGLLMLEAVQWRPHPRPWRLSEDAASAMGRFFSSAPSGDGEMPSGLAHGDFTPWNLLPTEHGWILLDWEETRAGAPPFFDLVHYLFLAHALTGHPSRTALLAGTVGKGRIGACIQAYAREAGLSAAIAPSLLRSYLEGRGDLDQSRWAGPAIDRARRKLLASLEG